MYSFGVEYVNRARQRCGRRRDENRKSSVVKLFNDEGRHKGILDLISGHRTRAVFDRYDIVSPKDLDEAARLMEKRLTAGLGTVSGTMPQTQVPADKLGDGSKLLN